MRALVCLVFVLGCGRSDSPPAPSGGSARPPAPVLPLPHATAAAGVPLAHATPVAVVVIGPHGEMGVGDWDGKLPATTEPAPDPAAVEAAIVARAKHGDDHDTMAEVKWTQNEPQLREWRDKVDETQQEVEFKIPRSYFGHFPAGLDPKREEGRSVPWEQVARLPIARAEAVDRVPPLGPLIASVPDAPALPIVRIAQRIGGALAVSIDGKLGVLRTGFRWAIDVTPSYRGEEPWIEVRAGAPGLDVIDLAAKRITPVAWDKLATLALPAGSDLVDILVAPDLTAQQLVDVLAALHAVHWVNLAVAPPGTAADRLAQVLAERHADRMAQRITIGDFYIGNTRSDDADGVIPVIRAQLPALAACYDERRPQLADPNAGIGLVFVLAPSGKLGKLEVQHDDAALVACVRPIIAAMKFPAAKERREVSGVLSLKSPD